MPRTSVFPAIEFSISYGPLWRGLRCCAGAAGLGPARRPVLETGALPTELRPLGAYAVVAGVTRRVKKTALRGTPGGGAFVTRRYRFYVSATTAVILGSFHARHG